MIVSEVGEEHDPSLNSYRRLLFHQKHVGFVKQEAYTVTYSSRKAGRDVVIPAFTRNYADILSYQLVHAEPVIKKQEKEENQPDFEEPRLDLKQVLEVLYDDTQNPCDLLNEYPDFLDELLKEVPDEEKMAWEQQPYECILELTDELRGELLVLTSKREGRRQLLFGELNREFNGEPAALLRIADFALFATNSYSAGQAALRCDDMWLQVNADTYAPYNVDFSRFNAERCLADAMHHNVAHSPSRIAAAYHRYLIASANRHHIATRHATVPLHLFLDTPGGTKERSLPKTIQKRVFRSAPRVEEDPHSGMQSGSKRLRTEPAKSQELRPAEPEPFVPDEDSSESEDEDMAGQDELRSASKSQEE